MSVLVVIRGNSASGKSTAARTVQQRFAHGACLVVPQDVVRRQMLRKPDAAGAANVELLEHIARFGLTRSLVVIVEGILHAGRYGSMLERLTAAADHALHYCFDLTFEETVTRHIASSRAADFTPEQMARWYHGRQPLSFADETRIDASWGPDMIVDRIHRDILAVR
ncbi:AAA family ATPase [Nocardia aurantiaca]|uniref:Kinase n=1 Tax=Nocardia aurantiaca TaxID=2675850 RepID=A0A6I3L9G5_9NOCA|nr:kinase [Nocardia aurantiaca]MTE17065.1 kinase [Nocardia aurantiaca]